MSRDYSKVAPQFWTGPTGKALRAAGPEALVVGCYFMTCPSANMIGLYYVPLPVLCHETGIPSEGASKVLRRVSATGFAHYDDETETVWVPEMARFQIADTLKPGDLQIKGVVRELSAVRKCKFSRDFYEKYRVPFNLPELSWWGGEVVPIGRPLEGPSKALRSQEQEQEQEEEPSSGNSARQDTSKPRNTEAHQGPEAHEAEAPPVPPSPARAGHLKVVPDNTAAREILDYLNRRTGRAYEPVEPNLKLIRARLAEPGRTVEQVRAVIDAKTAQWLKDPEMTGYLRPETLFGARKFAQYVGALAQGKAEPLPETPEEAYVRKQLTLMGEVVTIEQAKIALAKMVKAEGTHVG